MAKYLILFGLKGETVGRFMESPSDRSQVVRDLVGQLGGELDCYYFMFGEYDGMVIAELPDSATAATVGVAVTSTGAFSRYQTHELIGTEEMVGILKRAKDISYRPPGA